MPSASSARSASSPPTARWQPGSEPRRLAGALWSAVHGLISLWLPGALQRPTGAAELEEILGPLLAILIYPEGETHDVLDRRP